MMTFSSLIRIFQICGIALAIATASVEFVAAKPPLTNVISDQKPDKKEAVERAEKLLDRVRARSFPEISASDISVKPFTSDSVYFKARFSFNHFLTFRRRKTTVFVNPAVFEGGGNDGGVEAILAHELAHALFTRLEIDSHFSGLRG